MRVVIFDMDGTLIDSQHDIAESVNHVRAVNHGLPAVASERIVDWINRPERNLAKLFYGTEVYEERDRIRFEEHYLDQCIMNPKLYGGIETLLARLKEEGVKMAVATNAPTRFAERMIAHLGIAHHFTHIVGADFTGKSKPDPAMLHYILDAMGFRHSTHRAWMVGDNLKDIAAAKAAGITGIFSTWGFSAEGSGDHIIDLPGELLEIVMPV